MRKWSIVCLLLVVVLFVGCQEEFETEDSAGKTDSGSVNEDAREVTGDEVVATIENHDITGDTVTHELKRLELIAALQGDDPESSPDVSKSAAVQELIRTYMIRKIADDEGVEIDPAEQKKRTEAVREDIESEAVYKAKMEEVDQEAFWEREEDRYEMILASEELVDQFMTHKEMNQDNDVSEASTEEEQDERELKHNARETLDSWIQEELRDVDVEVNLD